MSRPLDQSCVVIAGPSESRAAPEIARAFAAVDAHVVMAPSANGKSLRGSGSTGEASDADSQTDAPADQREVQALIEELASAGSAPDVWVNEFSHVEEGVPAAGLAAKEWDRVLASTLSATFRCCQAAGRAMIERGGGAIINVLAPDAYVASAGYAATSAAMAGVAMVTKTLAIEWASSGVRVVGVAGPGPVRTGPERRIPLKRQGLERELAQAIVFLAGPDAAFINGEVLPVDGGWASYSIF